MKKLKAVLIDDDERFCRTFAMLSADKFELRIAHNGKNGMKLLESAIPDVVFLDYKLGRGTNGLKVLKQIKEQFPELTVIMITDYADVDIAVEAMKMGAFHYTSKAPNIEALAVMIERQLEILRKQLALETSLRESQDECNFQSEIMLNLLSEAKQVAATDATVMIYGECGVGKEIFARHIHRWSKRKDMPFVAINCSTLTPNLFESEFFGHEKGAFTGAYAQRKGKLEITNKGTIFLDEIADLPMESQAKILRAIEQKQFERLGGNESIEVDVRIIAATNKDLMKMVAEKFFREDLFYRLSVIEFKIPPLRQHSEDIEPLANFFLKKFSREMGVKCPKLSPEALQKLQAYHWPGNIRELKNYIERIMTLHRGGELISGDEIQLEMKGEKYEFPEDLFRKTYSAAKKELVQEFQKVYIRRLLARNKGNITAAAQEMGMNRSALHKLMNSLGMAEN